MRFFPARLFAAVVAAVVAGSLGACAGEVAEPIDPSNPPVDLSDVVHQLEPTPEMAEAAEQQCRDDAALTEGYVRAVDPATDEILAEITVDCATVE